MRFRQDLREATRAAHDAVDRAFSMFDLGRRTDRAAFLRAHGAALAGFRCDPADGQAARLARRMRRAISSDLRALGLAPAPAPSGGVPRLDPLAVRYVLGGSLLGLALLRRRAGAVGALLPDLPPDPAGWQDTCAELARAEGPRAGRVLADALALFAIYEAAARAASPSRSVEHDDTTRAA